MSRASWDQYAIELARVAATRSEDPYMKVGACVLRRDHSVASLGYNGAPPGLEIDWSNRDERRRRVIHAEVNALRYTNPNECYLLACTLLPCNDCLKMAAAHGIKKIIYDEEYDKDPSSLSLAHEFNMELIKQNAN